jgi:hypothetical protein
MGLMQFEGGPLHGRLLSSLLRLWGESCDLDGRLFHVRYLDVCPLAALTSHPGYSTLILRHCLYRLADDESGVAIFVGGL